MIIIKRKKNYWCIFKIYITIISLDFLKIKNLDNKFILILFIAMINVISIKKLHET